jgi:hypothetical protein
LPKVKYSIFHHIKGFLHGLHSWQHQVPYTQHAQRL